MFAKVSLAAVLLFAFAPAASAQQADPPEENGDEAANADPAAEPAAQGAGGFRGIDQGVPVERLTNDPGKLTLGGLNARLGQARDRGQRLRAKVNVLKDAILRGGPSADAALVHVNRMGDQFRLIELRYAIDGTEVYAQRDESGSLHEKKRIDILDGPIAPGPHVLAVTMVYRGHGYGPFKYLNKQTFEVKGSQTFTAETGKVVEVQTLAYERDDTDLAKRPAVSFKSAQKAATKPAARPASPVQPTATPAAPVAAPDAVADPAEPAPASDAQAEGNE